MFQGHWRKREIRASCSGYFIRLPRAQLENDLHYCCFRHNRDLGGGISNRNTVPPSLEGQKSRVRLPQPVGSEAPSSHLALYFTKMDTELQRLERIPQDSKVPQAERIGKKTWPVSWCLPTKSQMSANENTQQLVSVLAHSHVCSASSILKASWRM